MEARVRMRASFRDPGGFVFTQHGVLFRQVNAVARDDYDCLIASQTYDALVERGLLVRHDEVAPPDGLPAGAYKVIRPQVVDFISYPYEWCFSALRDAALATLEVQRTALERGMVLKDASAYNIQFHQGRPVLIDTLSLERYHPGTPWAAYRQFCRHFLAPLALMSYTNVGLSRLLLAHIDGIPLGLPGRLLPLRTRLNTGLLAHIHLHALAERCFAGVRVRERPWRQSKAALQSLVGDLEGTIRQLRWEPDGSGWSGYDPSGSYSPEALREKGDMVEGFLSRVRPASVWDLGANAGVFSRMAGRAGAFTVALDPDAGAVEKCYRACRAAGETRVLPLVADVMNPTPGIGWRGCERLSLLERGPADVGMALALVHHLAIANNLPLPMLSEFLQSLFNWLIIEFVPKEDPQAQLLLAAREDIFPDYCRSGFEQAFREHFTIEEAVPLRDSQRVVYLMRNRGPHAPHR